MYLILNTQVLRMRRCDGAIPQNGKIETRALHADKQAHNRRCFIQSKPIYRQYIIILYATHHRAKQSFTIRSLLFSIIINDLSGGVAVVR